MGFLDNSGDIILDAVLTDTGRFRLAKGDGSFKIAKFALADDEIDYGLYDKSHSSGSAYYDLQILQTPVFEAVTNNTSTMHNKLMTVATTNLLYLPVMEINTAVDGNETSYYGANALGTINDTFLVAVDFTTFQKFKNDGTAGDSGGYGLMMGHAPPAGGSGFPKRYIRVDQGLDTTEISPSFTLDAELYESQYIIEVDNRLGYLVTNGPNGGGGGAATVNFIDDDNIASYYFSEAVGNYVTANTSTKATTEDTQQVISGPRGSILRFGLKGTHQLQNSYYLFETLGNSTAGTSLNTVYGITNADAADKIHHIDTMVRVTGARTGYRIDVPVRFVRYQEG
jgi:hypothetical protein